MTLPPDIAALRTGVALVELDDVARVRISGRGAAALVHALAARRVPLRAGRAAPALLLAPDGTIFCDALVIAEAGGDVLLLAEGATTAELLAHVQRHAPRDCSAMLADLGRTHALLSLQGPFAWELVGALAGPDVLAAPLHTSFEIPAIAGLGVRAGKFGEYGYHLLVPRAHEAALRATLAALAPRFGLVEIGRAALSLCALEQGAYDPGLGCARLTPLELHLQWRVDYASAAPGCAAVRAQRDRGEAGRVCWWTGQAGAPLPAVGAAVELAGRPVGEVLFATDSPALGVGVGLALVQRALALPWLPCASATADGAAVALQTVAPPLLQNRSLFVHPHEHAYARREQVDFPPLVAPGRGPGG